MTRTSDREPVPPDSGGSWASNLATRKSMQANRRRDTAPELRLRSLLHRRGMRFRVDQPLVVIPRRRADLTFPRLKLAVFVDGCFWHGCPEHARIPHEHRDYWTAKTRRNVERDLETDEVLQRAGWTALRVWEHEDVEAAADRVQQAVDRLTAGVGPR